MFADIAKIVAKVAALVAGVAIVVAVFNIIEIPNLDISAATDFINTAYSVGDHYIPFFGTIWTLGLTVLDLTIAVIGARLLLIPIKWILKVNE